MITLRKVIEAQCNNHVGEVLAGISVLKSIHQGEPCTSEYCFSAYFEWIDYYGEPTKETIEQWLFDLGEAANKEIDSRLLKMIIEAD